MAKGLLCSKQFPKLMGNTCMQLMSPFSVQLINPCLLCYTYIETGGQMATTYLFGIDAYLDEVRRKHCSQFLEIISIKFPGFAIRAAVTNLSWVTK